MLTYQDLLTLSNNEKARMDLVRKVPIECQGTELYKNAEIAQLYYAKKNPTILAYQKVVHDALGRVVPDIWSANYKLTHSFFRQFVLQQVQYVLANGVFFDGEATKKRLGSDKLDRAVSQMAKNAVVDGVSFGFWNLDHLEVFPLVGRADEPKFAPIYDEETGELAAGVRYWEPTEKASRWTLYEPDGLTEYIQRKGEDMMILRPQQAYSTTIKQSAALGVFERVGINYSRVPIFPMHANDLHESELVGIRPLIDCYDFIQSGLANNIDETSVFYWTLKGTGGMNDADLAQFVHKMKQLKAAVLDRGVEAESHTIDVPVEANKVLLEKLKEDLYESFMLMNPSKALGGNITATAIRLAYQQQDDKCGDFEYCIRDFLSNLLGLLGIDDEPHFKWNRIANQTEEIQNIMTEWPLIGDDAALELLPNLTPEMVEQIKADKTNMEALRMVEVTEDGDE